MLLPKCDENNDNYWNWINCLKCWGILQSANFGRVFCPATRKCCYICCVRFCASFCPINARWNLSPVRALRPPVLKVHTHTHFSSTPNIGECNVESEIHLSFSAFVSWLLHFYAYMHTHLSKTNRILRSLSVCTTCGERTFVPTIVAFIRRLSGKYWAFQLLSTRRPYGLPFASSPKVRLFP